MKLGVTNGNIGRNLSKLVCLSHSLVGVYNTPTSNIYIPLKAKCFDNFNKIGTNFNYTGSPYNSFFKYFSNNYINL